MNQVSRKKMVFFVPKEYDIPRKEQEYPTCPGPQKESGRDEAAHIEEQAVGETEGDIRRT